MNIETQTWSPSAHAVTILRRDSRQVSSMFHPAHPAEFRIRDPAGPYGRIKDWQVLAQVANRYLQSVWGGKSLWSRLDHPAVWLEDLRLSAGEQLSAPAPSHQTSLPFMAWLLPGRSSWAGRMLTSDHKGDPRLSREIRTTRPRLAGTKRVLTVALVACPCLPVRGGRYVALFAEQAISVVLTLFPVENGMRRIAIRGMSSTLPEWPASVALPTESLQAHATADDWLAQRTRYLRRKYRKSPVAKRIGVGHPGWRVALGSDTLREAGVPGFVVEREAGNQGEIGLTLTPEAVEPHTAHAFDARVFARDPRSAIDPAVVDRVRPARLTTDTRVPLHVNARVNGANHALESEYVKVVVSPLVPADAGRVPDSVKELTAPQVAAQDLLQGMRTDTAAAINAFYHANALIELLQTLGFDLDDVFPEEGGKVNRPILIRYRGGMHQGPGKDGRTVNAQTEYHPEGLTHTQQVEVRFGLADDQTSARRSPLGLACDPRWHWHEYGHVLLAAFSAKLQLRFAHGMGDSLAAILCDPDSALATHPRWRFVTFPWVVTKRRHDRRIEDGWAWGGAMNLRDRYYGIDAGGTTAGYRAEQILSTTMFRLYRSLGGDATMPDGTSDHGWRRDAAQHSVGLMLWALHENGNSPPETATDLVGQMQAAGMNRDFPCSSSGQVRAGGLAYKVIRWAFQMQGAFPVDGTPRPISVAGGFGPVDLHLGDVRCPDGEPNDVYAPIADRTTSGWHAAPGTLSFTESTPAGPRAGNNTLQVRIRNLGTAATTGAVRLAVWKADLAQGQSVLHPGLAWTLLNGVSSNVSVPPNNSAPTTIDVPVTLPPLRQRFALLVAVSHAGDMAIVDKTGTTGSNCAFANGLATPSPTIPTPIDLLVACDNNLALCIATSA